MAHQHNRAARVAPKEGKWEAYFADSPRERCLGCTPEEALARLRSLTAERAKAVKVEDDRSSKRQSRISLAVFASVAVVGAIAAAIIVQTQNNVPVPHGKMYAHHRLHSQHDAGNQ